MKFRNPVNPKFCRSGQIAGLILAGIYSSFGCHHPYTGSRKRAPLLLVAFIVTHFFLAAQETLPAGWRHFTVADGLSSDVIHHSMQDSHGYMWISTARGISRYNGYEFEIFLTRDGLTDNYSFFCQEDNDGRIWMVGLSPELCYFSYTDNRIHPYKYNQAIRSLNVKRYFRMSLVVKGDEIWVGNYLDGYYHVNEKGKGEKIKTQPGLNLLRLPAGDLIYEVNETAPWPNGKSIPKYGTITQRIHIDGQPVYFGYPAIKGLQELFRVGAETYLRYSNALFALKNDSFQLVRKEPASVETIHRDPEGTFFVAYRDSVLGYRIYGKQTDSNYNDVLSLKGKKCNHFNWDEEGSTWISTHQGLYYTVKNSLIKGDNEMNLFSNDFVKRIIPGGPGQAFAWFRNNEIRQYWLHPPSGVLLTHENPNPIGILPMYFDSIGGKMYSQSNIDSMFLHAWDNTFSDSICSCMEVENVVGGNVNSHLWIATEAGIFKIEGGKISDVIDKHTPISNVPGMRLTMFYTFAFFEKNSALYFSNPSDGLFCYRNGTLTAIDRRNDQAKNIAEIFDFEGRLLLLTTGEGIFELKEDSMKRLNVNFDPGFINATVIDNNDMIWMGSNSGLFLYNLVGPSLVFRHRLSTLQGLPSNQITGLAVRDSVLWIGTDKGLCALNKNKLRKNDVTPHIAITSMRIFDRDTAIKAGASLGHDQNYLTFLYTGIAFKHQGTMTYRYRLEGLEENWQHTDHREVRYNSLPPGDYTFSVIALNEDKTPSRTAAIAFTILPPFWLTWWFISLVILAITGLVTVLVRWRIRRLRHEAGIRRRITDLQLQSLRAQLNPHFAYNTLNTIQRFILSNDSIVANDILSKFAWLMRRILENSRRPKISLSEELETLQLYLELEKIGFSGNFRYEFDIASDVEMGEIMVPSTLFQPYVENAIVHGISHRDDGEGHVTIRLTRENGGVRCVIIDNGIGREAAARINFRNPGKMPSVGMSIMHERLQLLRDEEGFDLGINVSDITDDKGKVQGTRVEIFIPVTYTEKEFI